MTNKTDSVQENSQSRLPKPGGEEILVRVTQVQDGDLFVVKEVSVSVDCGECLS